MVSDSIPNASIPMSASNPRDFAKKKRTNRSAKLKQCKLDARREQWLSQVKGKRGKEDENGGGNDFVQSVYSPCEDNRSIKNLEINPRNDENDGSTQHYSDSESPSDSRNSHNGSVLDGNDSGSNFTGSSSSSSTSSGGCCSGSISEEEEPGDDGCLDDWEAVADALAATDHKQDEEERQDPNLDCHPVHGNVDSFDPQTDSISFLDSRNDISKPKPERVAAGHIPPANRRAWTPNDAFRPQSLPNLSKQMSFPMNSARHYGNAGNAWVCKSVVSAPSSCPICCEDLDLTDSSFLPCACGFRLCLFCHKRILEEDGRCPGCRKKYDYKPVEGEATVDGGCLTFRLTRSCSMISRS